MSDRIFVTGGTGFIGSHLLRQLVEGEYHVVALIHSRQLPNDGWPAEVETMGGDLTDIETLPDLVDISRVFHLAGQGSVGDSINRPERTFAVNTEGTHNLLEKVRTAGVDELVYLSSAAVYGEPVDLPIEESHPAGGIHPYAASKLAGEHFVEAFGNTYGIDAATARGFNVYGPGQSSDQLIPTIIQGVREDGPLQLGNISPSRDFVHVADVVSGLMAISENITSDYRVYNIGSEEETHVRDVVDLLLDILNAGDVDIVSSSGGRDTNLEISRMVADCTRLKGIGWSPQYGLHNGLKDTIRK